MNCMSRKSGVALLVLGLVSQVGCASMNHTEAGAAHGAGIGAITGAIIGNSSGNAGAGALIGAATGGRAA